MKKLIALAMAVAMLALCAIPCFAEVAGDGTKTNPYELKKGTPNVDGLLDELYYDTGIYWEITEETPNFYPIGTGTTARISARMYILWDEMYLYYCVVVHDNALFTLGEEYHELEEDPWQEDCVEVWFKDGTEWKVNTDAYGYSFYPGNGVANFDPDDAKYCTTQDEENNSYVVEVAVPLPDMGVDRTLAMSLQVNSIDDEEGLSGGAYSSYEGERKWFKCIADEAVGEKSSGVAVTTPEPKDTDPVDTPDSKVTTAPEGDTTTAPKGDTTTATKGDTTTAAPKTEKSGCGSVVGFSALALIAMVAAPVAVFSKRK